MASRSYARSSALRTDSLFVSCVGQKRGKDSHDKKKDVVQLRARGGMVGQKHNPFPKSSDENGA